MNYIDAFAYEFTRHRQLAEQAMASLTDEEFFHRPGEQVNPIALIVKHLAGNLASRWSRFLTSDGDKPTRNRDREFVVAEGDSRAKLMADWHQAWAIVSNTLEGLREADLARCVTIRGEPHTVFEALLRGVNHLAYHTGQILYVARLVRPDTRWLTIPPGKSAERSTGGYLSEHRKA
jgi:hypothetical protein